MIREIIFAHHVVDEELSSEKILEIEEIVSEMLFKAWLKEKGIRTKNHGAEVTA